MLDDLRKKSNGELLRTYFETGGEILPEGKGFSEADHAGGEEQQKNRLALEILGARQNGREILLRLGLAHKKGLIDKKGQPLPNLRVAAKKFIGNLNKPGGQPISDSVTTTQ